MKTKCLIFSLLLPTIIGCNDFFQKKQVFQFIDYSECRYNFSSDTTYSVRIDSSGQFILRIDSLNKKQNFYNGTLTGEEVKQIDELVEIILKYPIDTLYDSDLLIISEVGQFNKIVIKKKNKIITSKSWNEYEPQNHQILKEKLLELTLKKRSIKLDTIYAFESLSNFY